MRRTKEEAAETHMQLLNAAEQLFLTKGFDQTSLDEIAQAVGVTRGAVHWHFKNKRGILEALRNQAFKPFEHLAARLPADSSVDVFAALEQILFDMLAHLQADERRRGVIRVSLHLDLSIKETDSDGILSTLKGKLLPLFQVAADRGQLTAPWNPASAAMTLSATISGLIGEWAFGRDNFQLVPYAQQFVRIALVGFGMQSQDCSTFHKQPGKA
ncbi:MULTISPECIES: TetR family transcriptional regulator [Rhizobium/Agrobacterium group]|nr:MULTISPECIES: TetR family transcriptional regulator [Rhizobium/Agrobacterium group]MUO26541.1 TetR family transcriptional regulator [Agrobacterium vitis]MUO41654.1 TetR family transcriptional regulator [Agrobacterium vitis]MUP10154.1 TetR family transcriptional regulator [Agrobacterium vitis]